VSAVVSDTSPLHYLVECEAIEILPRLFGEVLIPPTVHRELQHERTPQRVRAWAQALPAWIKIGPSKPMGSNSTYCIA
jgi:predicted nucleic acid-binding protein